MKSISKEALVGAVVLVAIAAFVAGTLWLRGKSPGGDAVYVVYSDVEHPQGSVVGPDLRRVGRAG